MTTSPKNIMRFVVFLFLLGNTYPLLAAGPYVLSVQQVKGGLDKASTPSQKGFVLIDVRSPEEHTPMGSFPAQISISIFVKYSSGIVNSGPNSTIILWCIANQGSGVTLPPRHSRNSGTNTSIMCLEA